MLIKGKVEVFTPTSVSGWLAAFGRPDDRVRLELVLDEASLAVATAEGFRPDVAALGFGDGACQFEFALDAALTPAEAPRLTLRIVGSDLCLALPHDPSWACGTHGVAATGPTSIAGPDSAVTPALPDQRLAATVAKDGSGPLKVFIVGSPRSGTSVLLRTMQNVFGLRAHSESHVMPAVAKAIFQLRSHYRRFRLGALWICTIIGQRNVKGWQARTAGQCW